MRVLMVGSYYYPSTCYGGPVWVLKDLAKGLAARGVTVEVVTTSANEPQDDMPRIGRVDGVGVRYEQRCCPKSWFFSPGLGRAVRDLAAGFDLLHVHGVWTYPTAAACAAARAAGKPYVVVPHGSLEPWALAHKAHKKALYLSLVEKRNLCRAAAVHCLTRREAEQVGTVAPEARREVIPNAVTIDTSSVAEADRAALFSRFPKLRGKRIALFLSRIHQKKGLDLLVPAFAEAAARASGAHLVIAGPDEGGYLTTVEDLVRRHGLASSVTFTGLVNGEEKRALFEAAELFVLPSYSEGLPLVVLEAMAMGLPVAITRECNLDEEVLAAGAGIVVQTTVESVAEGMVRLFADQDAAGAMGEAGRRLARERFSLEAVTGQLVELFEGIISGGRGNVRRKSTES